jgi:hypothetical protein
MHNLSAEADVSHDFAERVVAPKCSDEDGRQHFVENGTPIAYRDQ